MEKIIIRPFEEKDTNFIINSWLKNYKFSSRFAQSITAKVYYANHEPIVKNIINRCASYSLIATLEDAPRVILGYIVFQPTGQSHILHYVYVKYPFRGNGICSELMREAQIDKHCFIYTHLTSPVVEYVEDNQDILYNPYLI